MNIKRKLNWANIYLALGLLTSVLSIGAFLGHWILTSTDISLADFALVCAAVVVCAFAARDLELTDQAIKRKQKQHN